MQIIKIFNIYFFITFFTALSAVIYPASANRVHGIARYHDLKYSKDFKAFNYVNPNAPKGGTLTLGVVGTFDSANPFIIKGTPPVGLSLFSECLVFEPLMARAADEPFSLYGAIAEGCEIADDNSAITFYLNSLAKWADGLPITAEDVVFSLETLRDKGRPNMRLFYARVAKIEIIDSKTLKYYFKPLDDGQYDPEAPLLVALMSVIPKHIYAHRDFEKVSLEKVVGSGAYEIDTIKPGTQISYKLRSNYWAKDLPFSRGKYNFQTINVKYYREPNIARLAFAAGDFDFISEVNSNAWFNDYNFADVKKGKVIKDTIAHKQAVGMKGYCFNQRRPLFQDRNIRHALILAFPFEWINQKLCHGIYERNKSYHDNTELAASGLPTSEEQNILLPFKNELPPELYTHAYDPTDSLPFSKRLLKARQLLDQAGWKINNGLLYHTKTNKPLSFEILLYNKEDEKIALVYAHELKKLGITVVIRTVDTAQHQHRMLNFDFDCVMHTWGGSKSPGNEQLFYWGSSFADQSGSRNYPGIKRPVVDKLCAEILKAKNRQELVTITHALDRVLLWDYSVVPLYYNKHQFVAFRNNIGHLPYTEEGLLLFSTWWHK